MNKVPMTRKGYHQLCDELARLKKVDRPHVIVEIAEARAHGDLRENAEYAAAKERQGFIEGRIQEINAKLASAEIIEVAGRSPEKVTFGVTVYLMDLETQKERQYTIVGVDEADIKQQTISVHSPVAHALIGRSVGEKVRITTPAKVMQYEILKIIFE